MTSTQAAARVASKLVRRAWFWYVAAAVVFVVVVLLRPVLSGPETAERRIAEQVYDESCFVRIAPNARVARRWPRASKAEVISCNASENDPYPIDLMDYAQFASPAALSASLGAASAKGRVYCVFASTLVGLHGFSNPDGFQEAFRTMCAHEGGTLRRS